MDPWATPHLICLVVILHHYMLYTAIDLKDNSDTIYKQGL